MTVDFSYVGLEGTVTIAIAPGRIGEIEIRSPRGTELLFARTAPGKAIARGARVLVLDYHGRRHCDVAEWNAVEQYKPGIPQPSVPDAPPVETPTADEVYNLLDLDRAVPDEQASVEQPPEKAD